MTKFAYFEGKIVPIDSAKISVRTQALHYGTGCFGAIRGYWNEEQAQLYLFRLADHYKRFLNSAKLLRMNLPHSPSSLSEITINLIRMERWKEDCYIRPLAYVASEEIGCRLHDVRSEVTIFSLPYGLYMKADNGAHVTISSWQRVSDNVIPPRGKITGAYANSAFIKSDAVLNGFDEAIVLNESGHLAEGSAENVFIIRNETVFTPPITEDVLEGITRQSLITIIKNEVGVDVVERPIDRTEIYLADEVFFCGTGVQIGPITQVDHRLIGEGQIGPITTKIQTLYMNLVHGRIAKYLDWCTPIY